MRDDELDLAIRELTESVENHYVYENARLLGWLESYIRLHDVLDDVVAQVQKLLEASKYTLENDPMLRYDDGAFSMEVATKVAYEKVLEIIEECRRCGK